MTTPANSLNISAAGLVKFDGTADFTGVTVTNHNVIVGAASNGLTSVAPSATSGVPLISQGAASDPVFGTVTVAGGGTGVATVTGVLTGNGTSPITGSAVDQYEVLVGGASNAVGSVGPGSAGQVLQSGGAAANPAYSTATYPATAGTSGTVLQSNGTNIVNSTATYPATATGTGTILRANGTNWIASTATYPNTAGSTGNVLTSDGTNWTSSTPGSATSTAGAVIEMVDDFVTRAGTSALWSTYYWTFTSGSGAGVISDAGRPGVITDTNAGSNGIILGDNTGLGLMLLGGGEITLQWYVKIGTLSDVTNRYNFCIGFLNRVSGAPQVGCYFQYNDSVNSGNWQIINNSNDGSPTVGNTTVAADTNWHVYKIVVNAAATSVAYYIDGVEVSGSPLTTDISTVVAISPAVSVIGTSGVVPANTMQIDLFTMRQVLTTPR